MTTIFQRDDMQHVRVITRRFPHWKLFALVFALSFAATSAIVLMMPAKYESQMKILVSNAPEDLVITPNDGRASTGLQDFEENRVNSEIQVMTSRDVLRDVVMRSGLAHEPGTVSAAGPPSPWYLDTAVNTLGQHLQIAPIQKSDVISVVYKASSPEMANAVLHNLADSYLSMHVRAHAKPGSFQFFDDQASVFAAKLTKSEDELQTFRKGHALDNPNEVTALTQKALETERALDDTSAEVADAGGRIKRAIKTIDALEPRVTSQVHSSPQAALIAQLNDQLVELKNKRTELLGKFLPDDRLVKEVENEIAQTQNTLDAISAHPVVETTTDINQIRQGVEKDLATSEVEFTGLEARKATLTSLVSGYRDRLAEVAAASTQEDELTRAVKEDEQNYLLYSKEREESRIADSLDKQRITDVSIVESPTYEPKPVSPVIHLDLAIGFLLSLMVAYLSVRAWEMFTGDAEDISPTQAMAISA